MARSTFHAGSIPLLGVLGTITPILLVLAVACVGGWILARLGVRLLPPEAVDST
jgi:UPF0716 family protein affecting phage T7 exclusion